MAAPMPDRDTILEIYRKAYLIKRNDERIRASAKAGRMNLIYYSPRGQEIIPAALSAHLTDDDYICTIYRGIHDQLAKGVPSRIIWAEYAGRVSGSCKGKGGPMHITYPEKGVMVTTGVVGSSMPIATGLALASQVRGEKRVTIANFGDGASNIGAFHESLNLASIWNLPVIFLCQNNRYSEHSAFAKFTGGGSVAARAAGYGMVGISVDGNDPVAMWQAAGEAVERGRAGEGPTLIEAHTFRYEGHLLGDDSAYIPKEEMSEAISVDPMPIFRIRLLDEGTASEEELLAIEADIDAEVAAAEEFALASDWPDASELVSDVFAEGMQPKVSLTKILEKSVDRT